MLQALRADPDLARRVQAENRAGVSSAPGGGPSRGGALDDPTGGARAARATAPAREAGGGRAAKSLRQHIEEHLRQQAETMVAKGGARGREEALLRLLRADPSAARLYALSRLPEAAPVAVQAITKNHPDGHPARRALEELR